MPSAASGPDLRLGFGAGAEGSPPSGWAEADTRSFDWDSDGQPDQLSVDDRSQRVSVRWGAGSLVVTSVRVADPRDVGDGGESAAGDSPDPRPAAVADVTGDGWPDLIVVSGGDVRVLVGPGPAIDQQLTVAFTDIGSISRGWTSPPTSAGPIVQVPYDIASVRPLWDLNGDGADDFAIVSLDRRSAGPVARYFGRPCEGVAEGDRLSHRAGMPDPESIAGDGRAARDIVTATGVTATGVTGTSFGTITVPPTTVPPPPKKGRPTVLSVDTPDPTIVRDGNLFYLYTTNTFVGTSVMNVPVRRSTMLWNWDIPNEALPNVGSWSNSNKLDKVWAPAVRKFGSTYVLYYTARVRPGLGADNRQCIGRATASTPDGPFVDNNATPLVCQSVLGGSIDPAVFVDASGVPWLQFKNDGNCCGQPTVIWSVQLSDDGQDVVGPQQALLGADQAWEGSIVENPAMVNANGVNWLFYSGANWNSSAYAMGFGWCWGAGGSCAKVTTSEPWLSGASTDYAQGPGAGDFFQDANGGWWIAYHGWVGGVGYDRGGTRSLFVDKVNFETNSPVIDSTVPYDSALPPPPPVTGLRLEQTGHNQVVARWNATTGVPVDGYQVQVREVGGASACGYVISGGATSEAEIGCMRDGKEYDLSIAGWRSGRPGPESDPVRISLIDYGTRFVGLTPARVLDTRDGTGVPGGGTSRLGAGQTLTLALGNQGGLPAAGQFTAVVLNLTAVNPSARSHLRVFPGNQPEPPNASNLNFDAGTTIAASTTVQAAPDGTVKVYNNSGDTNVVADVVGYYAAPGDTAGALHRAITPARVLDTREGLGVAGGQPSKVGAGRSITVPLAGQGGLPGPGEFSSVILNVTAVSGSQASHLRVYPGDEGAPPFASSLNFNAGQTLANLVTVRAAADGTVKLYNQSGDVDIVADVVGYYGPLGGSAGAEFYAARPYRIQDTRQYPPGSGMNPLPAGQPMLVFLWHPTMYYDEAISAAVFTVTVDAPSTASHLTVWPYGVDRPTVSNLNFVRGQVIANQASVSVGRLSPDPYAPRVVNVQNNEGTVQVIVDFNGWFGEEATS